jgi:hypothetical protein
MMPESSEFLTLLPWPLNQLDHGTESSGMRWCCSWA